MTTTTPTATRNAINSAANGQTVTTSGAGNYLGDLVAWDIADNDGFSAPRTDVAALFHKTGFGPALDADSMNPAKALKKAVRIVPEGRNLIVKAMDRKKSDTSAAFAVYRKRSVEGEKGDKWIPGARIRVTPRGIVALPMEDADTPDPECFKLAEKIAAKANELVTNVTNIELSNALTFAGRRLAYWATYRRKMGGVWFVLGKFALRFRDLLNGLAALGGFYPIIQPLYVDGSGHTEKNVAYAAEGVLEAEMKRLNSELDRAITDGKMRDSTVEKRIDELDDLIARTELYSALLVGKADAIKAKAGKLRGRFEQGLNEGFDEVFGSDVSPAPEPAAAPAPAPSDDLSVFDL